MRCFLPGTFKCVVQNKRSIKGSFVVMEWLSAFVGSPALEETKQRYNNKLVGVLWIRVKHWIASLTPKGFCFYHFVSSE